MDKPGIRMKVEIPFRDDISLFREEWLTCRDPYERYWARGSLSRPEHGPRLFFSVDIGTSGTGYRVRGESSFRVDCTVNCVLDESAINLVARHRFPWEEPAHRVSRVSPVYALSAATPLFSLGTARFRNLKERDAFVRVSLPRLPVSFVSLRPRNAR